MVLHWGIDLGGTKIEGVVLQEGVKVLARQRVPTEQTLGYTHILGQIEKVIKGLSKTVGKTPTHIGIGTPGTLDPTTETLKNSNTLCLNGQPFVRDLEALLGVNVYIANDANCFALAESVLGAVPDALPHAKVVFGVILGTGVGGGVVVDGKVLNGRHGIAGEWGHNVLDASGGPCYCGKTGCVETVISGPSTERYYAKLSGKNLKLPEIVALSAQGDAHAVETLDRLYHFFGKAIAPIINVLDPDAIVIGGGVGNITGLYSVGVDAVKPYIFNPILETSFLRPKLGDSAGVFGAAMLK